MRMIALFALVLAAPAQAQDAAQDAADGYPLEARYTDNSANLPRDEIAPEPAPDVLLDAKGQVMRAQGVNLFAGKTYIFRVDEKGFMTDIRIVSPDAQLQSGEIKASLESVGGNSRFTILSAGPMAYRYSVGTEPSSIKQGQPAEVIRVPTCTLIAGVSAFEMWAKPLDLVILGPFYPARDGDLTCH